MDYVVYKIRSSQEMTGIIQAFIADLPFDTFQENDSGMDAFVPVTQDGPHIQDTLNGLQERFPFQYERSTIEGQNWNKVWESNFSTVLVDDFCGIRADFHPPFEHVEHEIVINPKMAFGTGHHATTFMVIELMRNIQWKEKSVLDYGSGTGILAILAAKLGCNDIDAVDIEHPAYLNMIENNEENGAAFIHCFHGILSDVPDRKYDIILANINRNVILDSFPALHQRLNPGGILITSGYLAEDQEMMNEHHHSNGFLPMTSKNKGKWVATKAYRRY